MRKVYLLVAVMTGLLVVSCESSTYDQVEGFVENPTYVTNIKPLIDNKCNACHAASVSDVAGGGTALDSYDSFRASVEYGSTLRDIDTTHTMPKNRAPLTKGQIKLIYAWKNTGFPQ